MSDLNTAPTQIAEPKKYKTKFCFAVIPAAFTATGLFFNVISQIAGIQRGISTPYNAVYAILSFLCWLTFTVILFIKHPNITVPVSYGLAYIFPNLVSIIFGSVETITYSLLSILCLLIRFIATAICVLFVLNSPAIKSFMKKTAIIWTITVPITLLIVDSFSYFYTLGAIKLIMFFTPVLNAVILFLLYRWLAKPYKAVTPAQTNPAPQYAQPVAMPVTPAVQPIVTVQGEQPPVQPVVQPPVAAPVKAPAQASVADEIAKYKALLDAGAITPEEFESLKTKLINKI